MTDTDILNWIDEKLISVNVAYETIPPTFYVSYLDEYNDSSLIMGRNIRDCAEMASKKDNE